MQKILGAVAVLIAAAAAWKYRAQLMGETEPVAPPAPFVFDNGSVRDNAPREPASGVVVTRSLPRGVLRKCVRGADTQYTNVECPAGYQERRVDESRVTVLETGGAPRPAPGPAAAPGGARKTLHDALDLGGDTQLRERAIERAIQGPAR